MMFLYFIFLLLLIKTHQEDEYYKLFEGERCDFQIKGENFYIFSKNKIYKSTNSSQFEFSSIKTIEIDSSYIPIYSKINHGDITELKNLNEYSFIVYENNKDNSNSYYIVIFNYENFMILYDFKIDIEGILEKKFFFIFENFNFAILGKIGSSYIVYTYYSPITSTLTTKTAFEAIYPELTCLQSYQFNIRCYYIDNNENESVLKYFILSNNFEITGDYTLLTLSNEYIHLQLFEYFQSDQDLLCIHSDVDYYCQSFSKNDLDYNDTYQLTIDYMVKIESFSSLFAISSEEKNVFIEENEYLQIFMIYNLKYKHNENIAFYTPKPINTIDMFYSSQSHLSCIIIFSDEDNIYYIPYTFNQKIKSSIALSDNQNTIGYPDFFGDFHTQKLKYPNNTYVFPDVKIMFTSIPNDDETIFTTNNDIPVELNTNYSYQTNSFMFSNLYSENYKFSYSFYIQNYNILVKLRLSYEC